MTAAIRKLMLLFNFLSCYEIAFCQKKISGLVLDVYHQPVDGASISIKNSNAGTISEANGRFSIVAKTGDVLFVSCVGMIKREVKVSNEAQIIVVLSFAINNMEEVMVVGYGTSKRKDITGAITRVTPKEFNRGIITNPIQQLQGKVAGLVITQPGGDPNGEFTIRLRGATSLEGQAPLLVIDGVTIDDFNNALSTLNPSDVESYDILKDASAAAIYGARGANGVILITTKKGRAGKLLVDYNGFVGIEKISNSYDVLSADEWRNATASMNAGSLDAGGNTDWQKEISQTGISQSHSIGFGGGTDQLNIRGSIGYIKQEGVIMNTGKEVITGRLTAIQKTLKNKLEVTYGIYTAVTNRDFLPDQTSSSQSRLGTSNSFIFTLWSLPVWPVYKPDGSYYQPPTNAINPLYNFKEVYSKRREDFFQGSGKVDYELFKGLKLGMLGAITRTNSINDWFFPTPPGTNNLAEASKTNDNKQIFSGDIHGHYKKSWGKHGLDITGVYEYNKLLNDGFGVTARGFVVPGLLNNNLGAATNVRTNDIFSYKNEIKLISFLGRAVYNYNDRYILTANFRRDGSSKFGPNNRWGNFPSVAFAWRLSDEKFLEDVEWLDNLKLRISYGLTGNQENLPPNKYQFLYSSSGPYLYNGQVFQGYAVTQENNPDLKWEVRNSFNVGIDFSVLNDRVNGTIDFFNDHTNDMLFLYDIPQPPFLTNKVYANAASAVNTGVEISLAGSVIKNKNFMWEVQANTGTLKNRVTKLLGQYKGVDLLLNDPSYGIAFGGGFGFAPVTRLEIGYPAGVFWLPQHAGLDANGRELYNNYDADGKFIGISTSFTDQDKVYIDPTPDFTWGLTNNFSFKNFDLCFFLRGVQGQKIFANALLNLGSAKNLPGFNITKTAQTNGFADLPLASTYWLMDGSFARMENITLGCNLSGWEGITNMRLYITATNLFVITGYPGIDPEIKTEGRQRYIDISYYPKTRGITFGVTMEL